MGLQQDFAPDQRLRKFNIQIKEAKQRVTSLGAHTNRVFQFRSFLKTPPQINTRSSSFQGVKRKEIRRLSPLWVKQVLSCMVVGNSLYLLFSVWTSIWAAQSKCHSSIILDLELTGSGKCLRLYMHIVSFIYTYSWYDEEKMNKGYSLGGDLLAHVNPWV